MTVGEAIEKLPVKPLLKGMIRTALRGFGSGILEKKIVLAIDRAAGTVAVGLEGETVFVVPFEEVEAYVQAPGA